MAINKLIAFIFDLDGTLVKLPIDYNKLRGELKKLALSYGILSEFKPLISEIERISKDNEKLAEECLRILEKYEGEAAEKAEVIPGAEKCLSMLKNRGMKIAIASNNSNSCVGKALKRFNLLKYIDVIIGREGLKVKPELLSIAMDKLNVNKENVIMIGDSQSDLKAAESIGIKCYIFEGENLFEFVRGILLNQVMD